LVEPQEVQQPSLNMDGARTSRLGVNLAHGSRILAAALPLLLPVFVPRLRPERWAPLPWRHANAAQPLFWYTVLHMRFDKEWLFGSTISVVCKHVLPMAVLLPLLCGGVSAAGALGGKAAFLLSALALNVVFVGLPIHAFGGKELGVVGIITTIFLPWLLLDRPIKMAFGQEFSAQESLDAYWWPSSDYDSAGIIVNLLSFVPALLFFMVSYALPPLRSGRRLFYSSLRQQLRDGARLRERAIELLASFQVPDGSVEFRPHAGSSSPNSSVTLSGTSSPSTSSDTTQSENEASPLRCSSQSFSDEQVSVASSREGLASALASGEFEPCAFPGGTCAKAAWGRLMETTADARENAADACMDLASILEVAERDGQKPPIMKEIHGWASQAAKLADSLQQEVLASLESFEKRASVNELKLKMSQLQADAEAMLDASTKDMLGASQAGTIRSIEHSILSGQVSNGATAVFARDAAVLSLLKALVQAPVAVAKATAAVGNAQPATCGCFEGIMPVIKGIWGPAMAYIKALRTTAGAVAHAITAPRVFCKTLLEPGSWPGNQKHAFRWIFGSSLVWLLLVLVDDLREFLSDGSEEFGLMLLIAFNQTLQGTGDATVRKSVLRLIGVVISSCLSYLGYVFLAWPKAMGPIMPALLALYLVVILLFAFGLGSHRTSYKRGWRTWAYSCQKFAYTFISAFCGAYHPGHSRTELLGEAWKSAYAVLLANTIGILVAYLTLMVLWPSSAVKAAEAELWQVEAKASDALLEASSALHDGEACELNNWNEVMSAVSLAASKSAKAATAHVSNARKHVNAAADFGGKFFGGDFLQGFKVSSPYLHHEHLKNRLQRAQRLALLACKAASILEDFGSKTNEADPLRPLLQHEIQRSKQRDIEQSLSLPLLRTPFFAGPPLPPSGEAQMVANVIQAICALRAWLQGARAAANAGTLPDSTSEDLAVQKLQSAYGALRDLRFRRAAQEAKGQSPQQASYPAGAALRFHSLCHVLCALEMQVLSLVVAAGHTEAEQSTVPQADQQS